MHVTSLSDRLPEPEVALTLDEDQRGRNAVYQSIQLCEL
jgi:hypothetical protein